jgi:hypothetical protein
MSKNQQSNDHNNSLMYLINTLGGLLDEDPNQLDKGSAGQFIDPNPMSIEEGVSHVASTYPPEDPIAKHLNDELIDELAEITGDELTSDIGRAQYIQDLQQTISEGGLEALDPEVLECLNSGNDAVYIIEKEYQSVDGGPVTLVTASINGENIDVVALEEGRVEFDNGFDDWQDIQQEGLDNVAAEIGAKSASMSGELGIQSPEVKTGQELEQAQPSVKPMDFAPS